MNTYSENIVHRVTIAGATIFILLTGTSVVSFSLSMPRNLHCNPKPQRIQELAGSVALKAFSDNNDLRQSGFFFQNPFSSFSNNNAESSGWSNGIQTTGVPPGSAMREPNNIRPVSNPEIWRDLPLPVVVHGGSLRTWSLTSDKIESVQVHLKTEGRPLNANIDLWHGPDNTPQKMGIYAEDGNLRAFRVVLAIPRGGQNAIAIRNTGAQEFPLTAAVEVDSMSGSSLEDVARGLVASSNSRTIQGGAVHTMPFGPSVASIIIMLTSDGRPLNARIELLQGPNNLKQVIEVYTEDGMERPFVAVMETPGVGNVIRIVNTSPIEFPLTSRVEPYIVEDGTNSMMMSDYDYGYNTN